MKTWLTRHLQTLVGSLGRLLQQRLQTAMTILVIGIALALPACLQMLIVNAHVLSGNLNRAVELSAYMRADTSVAQAEQVAAQVRQRPDVADVKLIKADQALAEFRAHSGFGEALDALESNPLPHALIIHPAESFRGAAQVDAIARDLRQIPQVELVQLDTAWVERFNAIMETIRRSTWIVAVLLAIGVAIIIGNTIRADIQSRRAEIEITKLVGGSDAFVRRPFLYSGIWYGMGGGLLALVLTTAIVILLGGPVARLSLLYGSDFRLSGLGLHESLWLFGAGIGLGWLGSWIAASWHLRQIEPS